MKSKKKSTILLVDDRPANIRVLEELLAKKDRILLYAESGQDALKLALKNEIDLIILDVQMPTMDGFEVAQILKSNKRTVDIPIIFATAEKKEQRFMLQGFEEGGIDYLFKPLDPEVTRAKVSVLLKLQLQKKELIEKNLSLERAALLINNSADIIGVVNASSLKFMEINRAFTTILGYHPNEVIDTSLELFLSDEDWRRINSYQTTNKDKISFETKVYCKDRSMKWLQWNVVVKDGNWFVNARDITLIKQVEKIRDYLSTVVKQSNDAIYIFNDNGQLISWNEGAEKIYGYSESEAMKMKIWNIIPEYLHEATQESIEGIINGQSLQFLETKRITKHGKLVNVFFSASLIIDPENGKKSIAITERDITQEKIAENQILQLNSELKSNVKQLEGANKELESFSYSVSHDLRAPLRILSGFTKMLGEDYVEKLDDNGKRLIETIERNVLKMGSLIDDLLEFSKMGKKEIQKSKIRMEDLVNVIVDEIKIATPCNATFDIKDLATAYADRTLINQVLVNLISNAVKYSGKNAQPAIEIGSYKDGEEIVFYVKDNGAGFDMAYADKLFRVFQRLHRPADFEGTGIGLAIVYRIVTRHGGRVWAASKVDQGATFYFTLPDIEQVMERISS